MTAFFSTFVAQEPDEDGEIGFETELKVINDTDQPIHQIQYKIWYSDPEGAIFEETDSYDDVFLTMGDQHTISPWGRGNIRYMNGRSICVRGLGCLARRDFRLLGEVAIPAAGESTRLKTELDLAWTSGPITVLVSRSVPDSEGDFSLEYKVLIENASTLHLKVVTLKAQLIDAEGIEIDNNENSQEIPSESLVLYSNSFYSVKSAQLEGAKAIFSLKAMIPVATFDANEIAEIGKE